MNAAAIPNHPPPLQAAIDEFEAWLKEYLGRQDTASKITTPLYHYTDAKGLCGIFETQQLWFTDYRHLNDPSEFLHGLGFARECASRLKQGADFKKQNFLDEFINRFTQETFDKRFEFYVASFSREPNDLSQWRAYADNGRGFAIGFAPRLFQLVEKPPTDKPAEQVSVVTYMSEDIEALYAPPLEKAAKIFSIAAERHGDLLANETIRSPFIIDMVIRLMAALVIRNLTIKHSAYKNEQEVRLIIPGRREMLSRYVKTRLRSSEIVPYIPATVAGARTRKCCKDRDRASGSS